MKMRGLDHLAFCLLLVQYSPNQSCTALSGAPVELVEQKSCVDSRLKELQISSVGALAMIAS